MKNQSTGIGNFFSFIGSSEKNHNDITNITFKQHNPENRILMIYNQLARSLRNIVILVSDVNNDEFRVVIEKIPYRGSVEIPFELLKNDSGDVLQNEIDMINVRISNVWEKYFVSPEGIITPV
ncbi:MAG: hypothetical protein ACOYN5_10750 [Bacteroidales bacterium]|jgi:hypothetical protein